MGKRSVEAIQQITVNFGSFTRDFDIDILSKITSQVACEATKSWDDVAERSQPTGQRLVVNPTAKLGKTTALQVAALAEFRQLRLAIRCRRASLPQDRSAASLIG